MDADTAVVEAVNGEVATVQEWPVFEYGKLRADIRGGAAGLASFVGRTLIICELEQSGESRPRFTAVGMDGERMRVPVTVANVLKAGLALGGRVRLTVVRDDDGKIGVE